MKAYSKRLLLITAILMPIIQGMHAQHTPDNIQALIQDAEQKVVLEARKADEMQVLSGQATALASTLQKATEQISQIPLDNITSNLIETLLNEQVARVLTSQLESLHIFNEQYEQHNKTVQTVLLIHDYQQRIQTEYDRIHTQTEADPSNKVLENALAEVTQQRDEISRLSQQLLSSKDRMEQAILITQAVALQAVRQTTESIKKIKEAVLQFAHQPGLPEHESQARAITVQIITSLLEIEQHIKTLFDDNLYGEALEGATAAQKVKNMLWPIISDDIDAMRIREQQVQAEAKQVKELIPAEDEPVGTQPSDGHPPVRSRRSRTPGGLPQPPQIPAAPSAPPVGPPGMALTNIKKTNLKLESALRTLDAVKGYLNQVDAAERVVIKKQVTGIFKEYEGLRKFAARIGQVKAANGQLDQEKLAPFDKFLDLFNKISAKVKSL